MRDAAQAWLFENPDQLRPTTVASYSNALRKLADYAERQGRGKLEDLTPALVRACEQWLMDPRRERKATNFRGGEGGARMVGIAARRLAAWLEAQDVPIAGFAKYRPVRQPERIQPRVRAQEFRDMEHAAMQRLMVPGAQKLLIARDVALLGVCADARLRASELAALNWSDVDPQTGVVMVANGKGGKSRLESVWDADERDGGSTMRALRTYHDLYEHEVGDGDGPLFVNVKHARLDRHGIAALLRRIARDAGLDGTRPPHAFRRGSFSDQYQHNPLALPALKQRMGWSDKSQHMVSVYTRGAELDLAANTPMQPTSKLWRQQARDHPREQPISRPPNAGKQSGGRGSW